MSEVGMVPGPHDPELVQLIMDHTDITSVDVLNELVDGINTIFEDVLEKAWMYDELG